MVRVPLDEQAQNKSISIKPIKILEVFENDVKNTLNLNLSEATSVLLIYFIENKKNKKLIEDLKKIKRRIDTRSVNIKPSF